MRILHIGWGFTPWRSGGLILYAEDLMAAQVARGYDVAYFFSGRHYPFVGRPRLHRWRRNGVAMREVLNSRLIVGMEHGTRHPSREVSEPRTEGAFRRVLRAFRPQVVHVHELLALPSSLIEVAAAAGKPVVMTLQDYQPLCATLRLVDADGRICARREVGEDCVRRNAGAPTRAEVEIKQTHKWEVERWRRTLGDRRYDRFVGRRLDQQFEQMARAEPAGSDGGVGRPDGSAPAFQRRRDVNVARLSAVDRLIAQSPRVAEIYRDRGVSGDRMQVLPFTLAHIERLRPRSIADPPSPLTFATLGGCASHTKGLNVVLDALTALREAGLAGSFQLRVFGTVPGTDRPKLDEYPGVEVLWRYDRRDLDELLEDIDVGIMPSIWEEAFGYSGLEMIAKGIPLIANPLGGIVEYAIEGRTAWHNRSLSGRGLAELMSMLIAEPAKVLEMHRRVLEERRRLIRPMAQHVDAIEASYREVTAFRATAFGTAGSPA